MKIGVTGGAGFIGSYLIRELVKHGYEVKVIDNLSNGELKNIESLPIDFVQADILDHDSLANFFDTCDRIIHLAALGSVPRSLSNPVEVFNSNVIGTLNVLEFARQFRTPILMTSSSSVYGSNTVIPKTEFDWLNPISPYAASKLSCEALFSAWAHSYNLNLIVLRLFNVFGPRQKKDGPYSAVIPKWCNCIINKKPIEIFGDGNQMRDFTFVGDVVSVILECLKNKIDFQLPINLAYGNEISLNELARLFKKINPTTEISYSEKRNGDITNSVSSGIKIRELFPNIYPTAFDEALEKTLDWYFKS
jgi:UDP-glucose 4-epimerase